ncbi:hypothetical protein L207DRAFT_141000 [Hyaloscypha variabilis F]|uniref:Uncharacterized protein n=1 Tax=Hyaloscypha variabilis (strain UAMH 11265 / GT02V1 / F) TaxID=1149755 RepID=A0A2J6R7H9_HYAVF|nr:hypothetical protein L207DRAFT_141000 [Hyaloscypha variabilis F]
MDCMVRIWNWSMRPFDVRLRSAASSTWWEFPKKGGSQARSCVCSALRPTTPEGRKLSCSGDEGEGSSALLCIGVSNQDSKLPLIHGINRCRARVKRQCGGLDVAPDSDDSAPPNLRPSTMLHRNEPGAGTGAPHEDQGKFTSFPNPPRIQFLRHPRTTPGRPGPRLAKGKPHGL